MVKWVNELSAKWQGWQEALGNVLWHSERGEAYCGSDDAGIFHKSLLTYPL